LHSSVNAVTNARFALTYQDGLLWPVIAHFHRGIGKLVIHHTVAVIVDAVTDLCIGTYVSITAQISIRTHPHSWFADTHTVVDVILHAAELVLLRKDIVNPPIAVVVPAVTDLIYRSLGT
jgi:hypothetical protein